MSQEHFRIEPGHKVDLRDYDTTSTAGVPEREAAEKQTEEATLRIGALQDTLYSDGRHALLVILQGMDASGKDGAVRKVFDHVNPTGVAVTSFKQPTALELRHDFLWRAHQAVPPRGVIGVFNRSYYEEVLIVRVHANTLLLPGLRKEKHLWKMRYELINDFERLLEMNFTKVLKFFLHISKNEQKERFVQRQQDPAKHWKLARSDFAERKFWDAYQEAYTHMLEATSTADAPWHVIPADRKWVRNFHIAKVIEGALEGMKLTPPVVEDKELLTMKMK